MLSLFPALRISRALSGLIIRERFFVYGFFMLVFEPRRSEGPKCHHLDGVEKFVKVGATHSEVPS